MVFPFFSRATEPLSLVLLAQVPPAPSAPEPETRTWHWPWEGASNGSTRIGPRNAALPSHYGRCGEHIHWYNVEINIAKGGRLRGKWNHSDCVLCSDSNSDDLGTTL